MQNDQENISNQQIDLGALMEIEQVPFSMDTIGWKILFAILIFLISLFLYKYYTSYKKNTYRRLAVIKIKQLQQTLKNRDVDLISKTMFHLKATALQTYNKTEVASLKGLEWLKFLDEKGKTAYFSKNEAVITKVLYSDLLDKSDEFNKNEFITSSIKWIKVHA